MNRIKELRLRQGLKQSELANVASVGQTTISNWEKGVTEVDTQSLFALADFFNTSTDYLLGKSIYPATKKEPASSRERLVEEFSNWVDEIPDDKLERFKNLFRATIDALN